MSENICPGCGAPVLFPGGSFCATCIASGAITAPENLVTCPGCAAVFAKHAILYYTDGRQDGVCPFCRTELPED